MTVVVTQGKILKTVHSLFRFRLTGRCGSLPVFKEKKENENRKFSRIGE